MESCASRRNSSSLSARPLVHLSDIKTETYGELPCAGRGTSAASGVSSAFFKAVGAGMTADDGICRYDVDGEVDRGDSLE